MLLNLGLGRHLLRGSANEKVTVKVTQIPRCYVKVIGSHLGSMMNSHLYLLKRMVRDLEKVNCLLKKRVKEMNLVIKRLKMILKVISKMKLMQKMKPKVKVKYSD